MAKITCFEEVLWDVFSTRKKIGDAPLNVAFRLHSFKNKAELKQYKKQQVLAVYCIKHTSQNE
jgi:hypothetical protein